MKDKIIIMKIQAYIARIARIYDIIKELDESEILALDDSFALTQFLTNIHSLFERVYSDEIAKKQVELGIRSLSTCRNISAHDYDSLNWSKVKQLCRKLISKNTSQLLSECISIAEIEESEQICYVNED